MHSIFRVLVAFLVGAAVFAPLSASAALSPWISFGGKVIDINFCANGAVEFVIKPAGVFPISYVWLPTTRSNFLSPVPTIFPFIGDDVLGVALPVPYVCLGPGKHPLSFVGLPVLYGNHSLLPVKL